MAPSSQLDAHRGPSAARGSSRRCAARRRTRDTRSTRRPGLTLLEILLVMALLATLAGTLMVLLDNAEATARRQLSGAEIHELRQAIWQFKKDTGFLPRQGPFDLETRPGGSVPLANIPAYVPPPQRAAWFDSPANFWQLYENPLGGSGHPLEQFNPLTARGWNGPYLSRFGEGLVDVGDDLQGDGSGSPVAGAILPQLVGVADPQVSQPVGAYLVWRSRDGGDPHPRWGRPYLMFDLDQRPLARLVGLGENRVYDGGAGDDVVLELFR